MSMLELDGFEARGDPGGSIGVTGEEDVLGQFAWTESDVVLPFSGWDRDPAIRGFSTRLSAFGKTSSSLTWLLRWRETRPRIVPRSHERQAEWIVLGSRSAELAGVVGGPPAWPPNVASRPAIRARQPAARLLPAEEGHGHRERPRSRAASPSPAAPASTGRPPPPRPANRLAPAVPDDPADGAGDGPPTRLGDADRGVGDRIAGQDDAARVVDDDDGAVGRRLDPADRR